MFSFLSLLELLQTVFMFLGYFSPSNSFCEQLSKQEEEKLIRAMKEEKSEEARKKLITHNLRLVAHVTKKYSTCSISQEDLLSIGTIGLIKGVNTFEPEKGSKFASYVAKCIDNEILMAIRGENKVSSLLFLDDVIGEDGEGNSITLSDIVCSDGDDFSSRVEIKLEAQKLTGVIEKVLSEREKIIIIMRYGLNGRKKYTQMQIAEMLNISRSYVSRIEKKAIEKISREFDKIV